MRSNTHFRLALHRETCHSGATYTGEDPIPCTCNGNDDKIFLVQFPADTGRYTCSSGCSEDAGTLVNFPCKNKAVCASDTLANCDICNQNVQYDKRTDQCSCRGTMEGV